MLTRKKEATKVQDTDVPTVVQLPFSDLIAKGTYEFSETLVKTSIFPLLFELYNTSQQKISTLVANY